MSFLHRELKYIFCFWNNWYTKKSNFYIFNGVVIWQRNGYFQKSYLNFNNFVERSTLIDLKFFLPPIIWASVILLLSIMPAIQLPETFFSPDKLAHAIVYGILVVLGLWAWKKNGRYTKSMIVWTILISSLYGCLMEIIQYSFFPGRLFEIGDNVANIIGCLIGFIFFEKFLK